MTPSTVAQPVHRTPDRLLWASVAAVLCTILLRAMLTHTRLPWWDGDPSLQAFPETTITPFLAFVLDAIACLGSAGVVWARRAAVEPFPWRSGVLVLLGVAGVLLHGLVLTPLIARGGSDALRGDPASLLLGANWAAAMVGAWALGWAALDRSVRRAILLTLLLAALVLLVRGAYQVFVEHPRVVADFQANRQTILESRGWEDGSATARLFERRLLQAEATGWFGLANVFGSVMGVAAVVWAGMSAAAWGGWSRGRVSSGQAGALTLAALAGGIGLWLSGSKGAAGAAVLGIGALVIYRRCGRASGVRWVAPALCLAVITGVVARGLIGERIAELSLLFRWHYLLGALKVIADHPLLGVGPAGFKDAYLLNKPPLSPEEVESAHSLVLDWWSTLGLFGVAWILVVGGWISRVAPITSVDSGLRRMAAVPRWFLPVAFILPMTLGSIREWPALTPDLALLLIVALVAAWSLFRFALSSEVVADGDLDIAAAAGAAALAAHMMIEVTGVLPGSAGWAAAILAATATRADGREETVGDRRVRPVFGSVLVGLAILLAVFGAYPAWRWERALHSAADSLAPVRIARTAFSAQQIPASRWLEILRRESARAVGSLEVADAVWPGNPAPLDAASRLWMRIAAEEASATEIQAPSVGAALDRSIEAVRTLAARFPESAGAWARLGGALEAAARLTGDAAFLDNALGSWRRAAALDPHSLFPAQRVSGLLEASGATGEAAQWARKALDIDQRLRLDPLKQLTEYERAAIRRRAAGVGNGPP